MSGAMGSVSFDQVATRSFMLYYSQGESWRIAGSARTLAEMVSEKDRLDIIASLNGDGEAYSGLVQRYQDQVTAQMWRFTRDRVVLEELVQDVFVEAYFSLKGFRGQAPFLHWLRRIATRVGYRYWKSRARKREREETLTESTLKLAMAPDNLTSFEAAEAVYDLLAELPAQDRLILTLVYFEECGTEEIAARTGWNRALVKVRLHRARKKLKGILNEFEHPE
jgi:RNA polymerase sigma-70 factor (ECF subfamily)